VIGIDVDKNFARWHASISTPLSTTTLPRLPTGAHGSALRSDRPGFTGMRTPGTDAPARPDRPVEKVSGMLTRATRIGLAEQSTQRTGVCDCVDAAASCLEDETRPVAATHIPACRSRPERA
jgi:hypothetical protein